MRAQGYSANGVHVALAFKNRAYWHHGKSCQKTIFDSKDIYSQAVSILNICPVFDGNGTPVHILAVTCFGLSREKVLQFNLFEDMEKKKTLVETVDNVNTRWGDFTLTPARMLVAGNVIKDRIGFGNVREL